MWPSAWLRRETGAALPPSFVVASDPVVVGDALVVVV
jgi:hypothetical protein